jgi:hypothetical protein
MLWMKPCLTVDLLQEFAELWHRYTAPSDDRRSTRLRVLGRDELIRAITELAALSDHAAIAVATARGTEKLATLADLAQQPPDH